MKNTTKKALKAMLILTMLVTLCVALAACAQTTETGTTDPIILELVNVGLDILAKAAIAAIGLGDRQDRPEQQAGKHQGRYRPGDASSTDNGRRIAADYRRSNEGGSG